MSKANNISCLLSMMIYRIFLGTSILQNLTSQCNIIHLNLMKSPKSSVLSSHLLANTNTNAYPWASSVPLILRNKLWN
ncbi:hypothetical protein ACHAXS_005707, partial [Conticribra weissflogii]